MSVRAALEALIFDCDGVIIESEHIHRQAYNDAFAHFDIRCADAQVVWDEAFYDDLQNRIGGGKPKMRWFFGEHSSWPRSSILPQPPATDEEKAQLIDTVQDWKTLRYQEIVRSGEAKARPGVIRLMDEARASGLKVAVCSAATRSSVVMVVSSLLGKERYEGLDCFIAGDDVSKKKPDPLIYNVASQRLQVDPANCLVVEDSAIGLQAALGAGMKCAVTYTNSTAGQSFEGASSIVATLGDDPPLVRVEDLMRGEMIADDRVSSVAA